MDSFTLNKIIGAVLFTMLGVFGLSLLAEALYEAETPEKPGYAVAVAQTKGHGDEAKKPDAAVVSIGALLTSASAEKGQAATKSCKACHTFEKGGKKKVGPNLWNIVGRKIASVGGFAYSKAIKAKSGEEWSFDNLNAFLTKPKAFIPGTKMGFGGLKKDAKRANVIAYLRSLSDAPKPLPAK